MTPPPPCPRPPFLPRNNHRHNQLRGLLQYPSRAPLGSARRRGRQWTTPSRGFRPGAKSAALVVSGILRARPPRGGFVRAGMVLSGAVGRAPEGERSTGDGTDVGFVAAGGLAVGGCSTGTLRAGGWLPGCGVGWTRSSGKRRGNGRDRVCAVAAWRIFVVCVKWHNLLRL